MQARRGDEHEQRFHRPINGKTVAWRRSASAEILREPARPVGAFALTSDKFVFAMIASVGPAVGDLLTPWRTATSLAGILIFAFISGRLLGARRSASAVLVSGLIGWAAGATVAVVIAGSQKNAQAGFSRHLWLFSGFFTMSATVWMEMLARPGALRRAQHRVATVPRPLRALRREGQRVERYGQIVHIAARYGLGRSFGVSDDETGPEGRAPVPVRLRRALEEAGGVFVKLGQVLSTRSDLFPADFVAELSRLQDHVPPASQGSVAALLAAELGLPVEEVFAEFEWKPVAAASVAQAHRARLASGETVIVKVQRPGIAEVVERDLEVLARLATALEQRASWAAEYRVVALTQEFSARIREELDFRVEGRNATELAHNMETVPGIRIPRVRPELTTSRVLVMEWLDGPSARQVERIDAMGIDRVHVADVLLRSSLHQMLVDGHFHADPHPGNVLVLPDGSVGLIDFGATGRLDSIEQSSVRQMMIAVGRQDPLLLSQAILQTASVRRGFDDDDFERAVARFMARYLGHGVTPSAAMFTSLLQLMFTFGVVLPAEFSTCFRTLVTLEGTLTTLSPGYQLIGNGRADGDGVGLGAPPTGHSRGARKE